jgi:hypothetical protein
MLKISLIIAAYVVGTIVLMFVIGRIITSVQFDNDVKELFAQSQPLSRTKTFQYQQLTGLPEPVQRYFKHVLKEGQSYIRYTRVRHSGQFKTGQDKEWVNIEGEQYFTTEKPGFLWRGETSMFTARDMYIADKGRLVVSLLSVINVVDGKGEQYNQGELLRWLSEGVWFPTNLLPSDRLQWTPIDAQTAKLTFKYAGLSLFYTVTFTDSGEIAQMETKRYMDEKRLETWIIAASQYKEINGVIVPTAAKVLWRLAQGDFTYAKFTVKTIEYDKPDKF